MDKIFNNLQDFFSEFPEYIYLIIGIVFLVLFIGIVKDKNWAVDPGSTAQRMFYNTFGPKAFRYFIGAVYLTASLCGFGVSLLYFLN